MLTDQTPKKWYHKTSALVIAFLSVGPFALPLLWCNPRFSRKAKVITSVIVVVLSYYLGVAFVRSLESLISYYQAVFQGFPGM
ncbi:MAG TPA: hypothetical protein VMD52_02500 [Patescibacteria group bacterium]|nr:hypothetical protein [Patescibacteria group bacterium]